MQKVYVLKELMPKEEMLKTLKTTIATTDLLRLEGSYVGELKETCDDIIERLSRNIADNPDGMWIGCFGLVDFETFIKKGREYFKTANRDKKYMVFEGYIEDDAQYWLGYKNENRRTDILKIMSK